jgi:hypothetical protein
MNKPRKSRSEILDIPDAPDCETHLVHLGNVRQIQPEILSPPSTTHSGAFLHPDRSQSTAVTVCMGTARAMCVRSGGCCEDGGIGGVPAIAGVAIATVSDLSSRRTENLLPSSGRSLCR